MAKKRDNKKGKKIKEIDKTEKRKKPLKIKHIGEYKELVKDPFNLEV
jgi:hypothetical protein